VLLMNRIESTSALIAFVLPSFRFLLRRSYLITLIDRIRSSLNLSGVGQGSRGSGSSRRTHGNNRLQDPPYVPPGLLSTDNLQSLSGEAAQVELQDMWSAETNHKVPATAVIGE